MIRIEKEIKKLNSVKGNVRAIQKKMKHVHNAARAAGQIHQWRANELQEFVDNFIKRLDEQIVNLEKREH
jgi:chromatin segregation and condensation protein Rec8/ScpA/Scc1 (kleisin family)